MHHISMIHLNECWLKNDAASVQPLRPPFKTIVIPPLYICKLYFHRFKWMVFSLTLKTLGPENFIGIEESCFTSCTIYH